MTIFKIQKLLPEFALERIQELIRDAVIEEFERRDIESENYNKTNTHGEYIEINSDNDYDYSAHMTIVTYTRRIEKIKPLDKDSNEVGNHYQNNYIETDDDPTCFKAEVEGWSNEVYIENDEIDRIVPAVVGMLCAKDSKIPLLPDLAYHLEHNPEYCPMVIYKFLQKYDLDDMLQEFKNVTGNNAMKWFINNNNDWEIRDIILDPPDDIFDTMIKDYLGKDSDPPEKRYISRFVNDNMRDNPDYLYNQETWPYIVYCFSNYFTEEEIKAKYIKEGKLTSEGDDVVTKFIKDLSSEEYQQRLQLWTSR